MGWVSRKYWVNAVYTSAASNAFGVSLSPRTTQVLPSRRCTSHKTTLTGKIVTQKPGTYILNFDNGFSK